MLANYRITIIVIILAGADHPESSEEADEEAPHDNFRLPAHSGAGGSRCHTFRHISSFQCSGTKLSKGWTWNNSRKRWRDMTLTLGPGHGTTWTWRGFSRCVSLSHVLRLCACVWCLCWVFMFRFVISLLVGENWSQQCISSSVFTCCFLWWSKAGFL